MSELSELKILVIDDSPAGAYMTSEILINGLLGVRDISIAQSPLAAMFLFANGEYDLVICNAQLEAMTGAAFIQQVRSAGISAWFLLLSETEGGEADDLQDPMVFATLDRRTLTADQILCAIRGCPSVTTSRNSRQLRRAAAW